MIFFFTFLKEVSKSFFYFLSALSYPRSSSLASFCPDFCEELIYIEDTIVLENRALFQAIVL